MLTHFRCISHGVEAHQRLRQYDEAVNLLRYLLFNEGLVLQCEQIGIYFFEKISRTFETRFCGIFYVIFKILN